jgi:hypothetical protein
MAANPPVARCPPSLTTQCCCRCQAEIKENRALSPKGLNRCRINACRHNHGSCVIGLETTQSNQNVKQMDECVPQLVHLRTSCPAQWLVGTTGW